MIYANTNPAADQAMENHHYADQQEPEIWCHCDQCGGDIYKGESYYYFDSPELVVCNDCIATWAKKYIETARRIAQDDGY
jgi:hypothetical protein